MQPENTYDWLIEKLLLIVPKNGSKLVDLKWDMFIPDGLKPKHKPIDEYSLSSIFGVLDEMLEVCTNKFWNQIEILLKK